MSGDDDEGDEDVAGVVFVTGGGVDDDDDGGDVLSAAAMFIVISIISPSAPDLTGVDVFIEPVIEFQIGEEVGAFRRGEQSEVVHVRLQEVVARRGEPQQCGDGRHSRSSRRHRACRPDH